MEPDVKIPLALNSANAIFNKTSKLFINVCETDENYLFVSLDEPTRS
ncbi:MAG: hypothetical protein MJ233_05140 [Mycoplasmoidaceae bacterium]|nr:hypothetical protein [Mycoplasmoidaceae bacterium]